LDGFEDAHVSGAAAEVSGEAFLDLQQGWVRVLLQQVVRGEDHAWGADTALGSAVLEEALLDGVERRSGFGGKAFNGGDLSAFGLEDGNEAGVD